MRPIGYLLGAVAGVLLLGSLLAWGVGVKRAAYVDHIAGAARLTGPLGLSDLALSTEARYTRHPAVSDRVVIGMDHPGSLDHFPSGSFFNPIK